MNYTLCKYQKEAVNALIEATNALLESKYKNKYILMQAITGAGKTVIASDYINEFYEENKDTVFIWISIGTGKLHEQSRKSLKEKVSPSLTVKVAEDALSDKCLHSGDILVLNWESLNTIKIDEITGEEYFDNILMRDGEKLNLRDLWKNTRQHVRNVILMIDESHNTASGKAATKIIETIGPNVTIELTATPRKDRIPTKVDERNKRAYHIPILTNDVISEGVIKKDIHLNSVSEIKDFKSSTEYIIRQGLTKRLELKDGYLQENTNINPLLLIQLPDGLDGELKKEDVLSILSKQGYSVENKRVAIWLSKEKVNLDNIREIDNNVDVLVFKQAVATGWDCPRASILVKLRDTKSTIFDLQTLGRILRMPERKHYSNEILNSGYVYTNSNYSVEMNDYDNVLTMSQSLRKEFKDEIKSLSFIVEKLIVSDVQIDGIIFKNAFANKTRDMSFNYNLDSLSLDIISSVTATEELEEENISTDITETSNIAYTKKDIQDEYRKFIKSLSNKVYPYNLISNTIRQHFSDIIEFENTITNIKKFILVNKELIKQCVDSIKKDYAPLKVEKIEKFSFKDVRNSNSNSIVDFKKCAYYKHFESNYDTEKAFEAYMENIDTIKYWIKNADSGDGFSIVYTYENKKHEFYPDYIVKFYDGTIGIYEVKDFNDKEKETITAAKIKRLQEYCRDKENYKCGLIEIKNNTVYNPPQELQK